MVFCLTFMDFLSSETLCLPNLGVDDLMVQINVDQRHECFTFYLPT